MKLTQENEKLPQNYYGKTKLIAERYLINKLKNKKISCVLEEFLVLQIKKKNL